MLYVLQKTDSKPSFYFNNFNFFLTNEQNHFIFNNLKRNEEKEQIDHKKRIEIMSKGKKLFFWGEKVM